MMKHPQQLGRRERGASMLVSLAFLTVMATIGATLANVTSLEERMASNTRDRDLALQAAEAALADAEVRLKTDADVRTDAVMVDAAAANTAAYWENCFVNSATACATRYEPAQALPHYGTGAVAQPPKYIVQKMPAVGTTEIFRVTARAVGGTADTVVVLQAEFGYTP